MEASLHEIVTRFRNVRDFTSWKSRKVRIVPRGTPHQANNGVSVGVGNRGRLSVKPQTRLSRPGFL